MLLEQKRIILKKEKEKYIDKEKKIREDSQKILDEAIYNLKIANMEIGIENMTDISESIKIDENIDIKYMSIMGVEIPSIVPEETKIDINYGLYSTTSSVDNSILKFIEYKKYIIDLAQIENTILRLEKEIEKVQRRSNALKEIIIPEDEKLAKEIQEILDENEREEFIRLKKLKSKGRI